MPAKFIDYLKFVIKSKNHHGIQSPFVYDLVTKCFYHRRLKKWYTAIKKGHRKQANAISFQHSEMLFRLLHYFNIKDILLLGTVDSFLFSIIDTFPTVEHHSNLSTLSSYDLICLDPSMLKEKKSVLNKIFYRTHNDTIIWVVNPHKNTKINALWESFRSRPEINVSIDTFFNGLLFFRKEQAKEHFFVRFKAWYLL